MNNKFICDFYRNHGSECADHSEDTIRTIFGGEIHKEVTMYLHCCLPVKCYFADVGVISDLNEIRWMMSELPPAKYLGRCGFVPFVTTGSGNILYVDLSHNGVFFGDSGRISEEDIWVVPEGGGPDYTLRGITKDNIRIGLDRIDDSITTCVSRILRGELNDYFRYK